MNKAFSRISAMILSVMLALSSVPYSYAATVDTGENTSYSVQDKKKAIAKAPAAGGADYAAVLRTDKVANDAQTKTKDGYSQQVETKLTEAEGDLSATYFEQDKYLSDPTGEKNGQSTYNVTLENAYVGPQIQQPAPNGQDIIIIEDASASMNERVQYENQGVQNLLAGIRQTNYRRIQNAKNGQYSDFDPEGKTDAEVTEWMKSNGKLLRLVGVESFNYTTYTKWKGNGGSYVLSDSDVSSIAAASALKNGYPNGEDLKDLTATDLALQNVRSWITNAKRTSIVLLTDGEPYGAYSNDDLSCGNTELMMFNSTTANNAINIARDIKAQGTTIYASFMFYERDWDNIYLQNALKSGNIDDLKMPPYANISAVTMSLISSDYPGGGHLGTVSGGTGLDWTFTVDKTNANGFGTYMKLMQNEDTIAAAIGSVSGQIDTNSIASALKESRYASVASYVLDDISYPFELNGDVSSIKVYQVPRVPKNLDSTGHPADATNVTAFTWGEKEDITDQVSVTLDGNRIKVTGYNYESNALTNYDHDTQLPDDKKPKDPSKYEKGDYGYKLVIEFPICAKQSFGGNDIETNDSTTSGFYPSKPGSEALAKHPKWESNSSMNPGGHSYIALYPVPIVDLKVNYAIVDDNVTIYAPQTEKLVDLVSAEGSTLLFSTGETAEEAKRYEEASIKKVEAENKMQRCKAAYKGWQDKLLKNQDDQNAQNGLANSLNDLNEATAEYREALDEFEKFMVYIPDGDNNAFVNITYTLKDPDGEIVGTMNVPHGTALTGNADGTGNLKWTFKDGADAIVKKSGTYTVSATVTPVKTTRAESHTGSSDADATCQAKTYTKNPTAHIFVLQITMKDTQKKPGQSLDFANDVAEDVLASAKSQDKMQVHWLDAKWVCTDGTTQSNPKDEPADTGSIAVGKAPTGTVSIADMSDVDSSDGSIYVSKNAQDGGYIPVKISVHRTIGDINKTTVLDDQLKLTDVPMSDDDHVYGTFSSVMWKHVCDSVDDCDNQQMKDAHDKLDDGKYTGQNAVRFLVHINNTVLPDVAKETSTPSILRGQDIDWTVTVSNADEAENEYHKTTKAQMLDVLPYLRDKRTNPNDNTDTGSSFSGDLYFKTIRVDCASAAEMTSLYANGTAKFYYTEDTAVRTATREEWHSGNITWTAVTPSVNGNTVSFQVPKTAVAIKSDTTLQWNEKVVFHMTANIKNPDDQKVRDLYINQAAVGDDDEAKDSNPVVTRVTTLSIKGTIWNDDNMNGQMDAEEEKTKGIRVTLYRDLTNESTAAITLDGTRLEKAYNDKEETIAPCVTGDDGTFEFTNLLPGTYYVVATEIPEEYKVTKKQAANTDNALNSKAEENMPAGQTAWIKRITVSDRSVEYQNIGLVIQKGTLTIRKAMKDGTLYYPASMTDEQKKDLVKGFVFKLTSNTTGEEYSSTIYMDIDHTDGVSAVFEDLPLGTYTLKEVPSLGYKIASMEGEEGNFSYNVGTGTATIQVVPGNTEIKALVTNDTTEPDPGVYPGESVANKIGTALPIKFIVEYTHGDINDTSAVSYTFKESDFANMTVWYDDGTYRDFTGMYKLNADGSKEKLSDDRLKFSEVTLSPATITNEKNTSESGNKVDVKAYYTERSKTLSDKFEVGVNLAPVYKFTVVFHANGSTISGADTNEVRFMYNDTTGANEIISGVYKLPDGHSGWTFAGWNTATDGSGVNYGSLGALNEIGRAKSQTSRIDLYAHWTTTVTFNANGGVNYRNGAQVESVRTVQWNVYSTLTSDGMTAARSNYGFIEWNDRADGSGSVLFGQKVLGPITLYARYYPTYYGYTGNSQAFVVPKTGTYRLTAVGASGGYYSQNGNPSGNTSGGATVSGDIHLTEGTVLYVYVGGAGGYATWGGTAAGGWNGGGSGGSPVSDGEGTFGTGGGGGATDFRTINSGTNWGYAQGLSSRIMVAAGGGGGGRNGWGAVAGLTNGLPGNGNYFNGGTSGGLGASQYGGGANGGGFGYGGSASGSTHSGGGGAGWYGGGATPYMDGGGSGSSYVSGASWCAGASSTGYVFTNVGASNGSYHPLQNGYATVLLKSIG